MTLYPWEARTGCPTCKSRPGERCVTMPRHPASAKWLIKRPRRPIGSPTTAHKARYQLWCYLWGRDVCTRGAAPTIIR